MSGKHFSQEELDFMQAVGLQPDDLSAVVAEAPVLPDATRTRLQQLTRQKLQLAVPGQAPAATVNARVAKPGWPRWLSAVAAVVVIGMIAVTVSPAAQAALQRLMRFVPGIGITETEAETLVLAEPVTVSSDHGNLTIKAFIATGDYSELRYEVDGITPEKVEVQPGPNDAGGAVLVLPDGTRLYMTGAMASGGEGYQSGTIWFPAFPSPANEVTVELDGVFGLPDKYAASFNVIHADTARLETALPGNKSAVHHGIELAVPHLAMAGDRIVLTLDTNLEPPATRRNFVARTAENLVLSDDMGHRYELLAQESNEYGDAGGPISAVFAGPVQAGATSLHLSVNDIEVVEQGRARLRVPLSQLPLAERLDLNRTLAIGRWTATVYSITRLDDDTFDIELGVSDAADADSTLQYIQVRPYRVRGGHGYSYGYDSELERAIVSFSYNPTGRHLDLEFHNPTVEITGPWEIELPVK